MLHLHLMISGLALTITWSSLSHDFFAIPLVQKRVSQRCHPSFFCAHISGCTSPISVASQFCADSFITFLLNQFHANQCRTWVQNSANFVNSAVTLCVFDVEVNPGKLNDVMPTLTVWLLKLTSKLNTERMTGAVCTNITLTEAEAK